MLEADITLRDNPVLYIFTFFPPHHNFQPQQPNSVVSGSPFGQMHELTLEMKHEVTKSRGTIVRVTT